MQTPVPSFHQWSDGGSYTNSLFSRQTIHVTPSFDSINLKYEPIDVEAITWKREPITSPEFYDRSLISRRVALLGVFVTIVFGAACIFGGIKIFLAKNAISAGVIVLSFEHQWQREGISLGLNLLVAVCTEATGFVHNITLRAALASERRLRFNTNLRLISAARGFFNPNGTVCNIVMAFLLIISYSSSILATLAVNMDSSSDGTGDATPSNLMICVGDVPLIVLGTSLLLQAIIAITGMWSADVLTWSSSPFDITAALVHNVWVEHVPGRCMRGVDAQKEDGPAQPRRRQPSAWTARPSVRKVVVLLWVLVFACFGWGLVVVHLTGGNMSHAISSWSFFPDSQSYVKAYNIPLHSVLAWFYWVLYYLNTALVQGPLTLALHCSELITNVIRDENVWRRATRKSGARISTNPLVVVFGSPLNVALLCAKPLLHWMLGLAMSLAGTATSNYLTAVAVSMFPIQIFNLTGALFLIASTFTVVSIVGRSGPQPAAYGHIQTLANLIDKWSPVMWWGHKSRGLPYYHAGEYATIYFSLSGCSLVSHLHSLGGMHYWVLKSMAIC
ncbi:hypothetical protein EDD17DRAFT_1473507 [Pisolithus thermaeus]|nr:hypothetical protein EDD17DRAFT_1473507 [Pisolithus thermaeus]